jgi:hypothetical protein
MSPEEFVKASESFIKLKVVDSGRKIETEFYNMFKNVLKENKNEKL